MSKQTNILEYFQCISVNKVRVKVTVWIKPSFSSEGKTVTAQHLMETQAPSNEKEIITIKP